MIIRQAYLDQIIPLIDKNLIKVLTGVRRSGKTVLLSQIQDYLLEMGVSKNNIININLESKKNKKYKNDDVLYDYLLSACEATEKKLIFFLTRYRLLTSGRRLFLRCLLMLTVIFILQVLIQNSYPANSQH